MPLSLCVITARNLPVESALRLTQNSHLSYVTAACSYFVWRYIVHFINKTKQFYQNYVVKLFSAYVLNNTKA